MSSPNELARTVLKQMFEELDNVDAPSEERMRADLAALGVDIKAVEVRFKKNSLEKCRRAEGKWLLDEAKRQRLAAKARRNFLPKVQARRLSIAQLQREIRGLEARMAHMNFENWTLLDYETALAELMALQERRDDNSED